MSLLAFISIIIGISKIFISMVYSEENLDNILIEIPINKDTLITIVRGLLSLDGLISIACGLYILFI